MRPATMTSPDASRDSVGLRLICRAGVFRRIGFGLLPAIVTADGDLLAAYLDIDSAVVDVPITHRAFSCIHSSSFLFRVCIAPRPSANNAAVFDERIVPRREGLDFQILAHFAQPASAGAAPYIRRRAAKFAAEGICEMAMAGKTQFEGFWCKPDNYR